MTTRRGELLAALSSYRSARIGFLEALGCSQSNRDPFAEFAEVLAHAILGGSLAVNRVQKDYDLVTEAGEFVQVRYLANPNGPWVNGHIVDFRGACDIYALLIIEAFDAKALITFSSEGLADLCDALGRRHGEQRVTLQLTRANYKALRSNPTRWNRYGVNITALDPPATAELA